MCDDNGIKVSFQSFALGTGTMRFRAFICPKCDATHCEFYVKAGEVNVPGFNEELLVAGFAMHPDEIEKMTNVMLNPTIEQPIN